MKTKAYCLDCKDVREAKWIPDSDIGGQGYYQCCQCGGDYVTTDYGYCDMCGQAKERDDLRTGLIFEYSICSDCINSAAKEFESLAEAKIFGLHTPAWRDAVNIAHEGREI